MSYARTTDFLVPEDKKVDYTVDELIEDYVAGNDYEESDDGNVSHIKLLRNAVRSCFFFGIVRALAF